MNPAGYSRSSSPLASSFSINSPPSNGNEVSCGLQSHIQKQLGFICVSNSGQNRIYRKYSNMGDRLRECCKIIEHGVDDNDVWPVILSDMHGKMCIQFQASLGWWRASC